jgi:hypothetical protein
VMDNPIYARCDRGDTTNGAERGNCAVNLVCTQLGSAGPNCYQQAPCPSGMKEPVPGLGVCLRECMLNSSAPCLGQTSCQNVVTDADGVGRGFCYAN